MNEAMKARNTIMITGWLLAASLAAGQVMSADAPPRLKYRAKGAVCACSSGLSEADISRALSGLDRLQNPQDATPAVSENRNEQTERSNDNATGTQK